MCVPWARSRDVQYRRAGIDLHAEFTDSPPGTEQGSDNVTERHTFGDDFGGPVSTRRGRGPRERLDRHRDTALLDRRSSHYAMTAAANRKSHIQLGQSGTIGPDLLQT